MGLAVRDTATRANSYNVTAEVNYAEYEYIVT